jgi:hypothetical protein
VSNWGNPHRCCVLVSQRPSNIRKSSFGEGGRSAGRPWCLLPNGFEREVSISVHQVARAMACAPCTAHPRLEAEAVHPFAGEVLSRGIV